MYSWRIQVWVSSTYSTWHTSKEKDTCPVPVPGIYAQKMRLCCVPIIKRNKSNARFFKRRMNSNKILTFLKIHPLKSTSPVAGPLMPSPSKDVVFFLKTWQTSPAATSNASWPSSPSPPGMRLKKSWIIGLCLMTGIFFVDTLTPQAMEGWTNPCLNEWMHAWTDERTNERMNDYHVAVKS